MQANLAASLEAVEAGRVDLVTQEMHLHVLQMAATDFTEARVEFVKEVISKFQVTDRIVVSIFGKAAVPSLVDDQKLRKCLKARQDLLYRMPLYQYSFSQPLGFVELLDVVNSEASWADIEKLIGQYSLDPDTVLGMQLGLLSRTSKFELFETSFKESLFDVKQLLALIHWRLSNLSDWEPTLYVAAGLVDRLFKVEDIYSMFGPDSTYTQAAQDDWESKLMESSGSSQFNALLMAGSLDGDNNTSKSKKTPVVRQRAVFAAHLVKFGHVEFVYKLIRKFPFMVQMNDDLADFVNSELIKNVQDKELLHLAGPSISRSIDLIAELCKKYTDYESFRLWLLPCISLIKDPRAVDIIWGVLATFSEDERFALYTEWQYSLPRYHKAVKYAIKAAEKKTQNVLKRISNENVREMLAQFSELAVSNPYSVFSVFISQVESYDKIGKLILQEPKFNRLSWDVIPLVILVQLSSGRSQQGDSGLFTSKWAQALSRFTAHLAAGHAEFDCSKLLKFVLKQFHQNNFDNIVLLKDLFLYMGGSIDVTEVSYTDIRLLGGSRDVRMETKRRLFESMPSEEVISRLLAALTHADIILEMFLGLVYAKKRRLHDAGIASPKVLGHLYDETSFVLQQYCTLLSTLEASEFEKYIPGVSSLVDEYAVPIEDAMNLWRPLLAERVRKSEPCTDGSLPRDLQPILLGLAPQSTLFSNSLYVTGWTLEPYDIYKDKNSKGPKKDIQKHELMRSKCNQRLSLEQAQWFNKPEGSRHTQMLEFLTKVVIPRALNSGVDAVYAADFLFTLNRLGVVHFGTLSCFKTLFCGNMLYNTLISCTAIEAECLGWFIYAIFTQLIRATENDESFARFQDAKPDGSSFTACLLKTRDENPGTRETNVSKLWTRKEVYTATSQWASRTTSNLADALRMQDYSTIRNAISILKTNLDVLFKTTSGQLTLVQSAVDELKKDERSDIVVAATALSSQLSQIKELSCPWVETPQPLEAKEGGDEPSAHASGAEGSSLRETPVTPDTVVEAADPAKPADIPLPARPSSPSAKDWLAQREMLKKDELGRAERGRDERERSGRGFRRDRDRGRRDRSGRGGERERGDRERGERGDREHGERERGERERGEGGERSDRSDRASDRDRSDRGGNRESEREADRDGNRSRWSGRRDGRGRRETREREAPLPPPPPRSSKRTRLD